MKTTQALIDLLQADSKLRHLCGFDLRFALSSEATFSRAFDEFPSSELMQRVHANIIEDSLGEQLDGYISRDTTAIEARESIEKKDKTKVALAKPQNTRGRPPKSEIRPAQSLSPFVRQSSQTLEKMLFELDTACATGTKKNAQEYKISWKGYKLDLDTACCGVPISAVLTGRMCTTSGSHCRSYAAAPSVSIPWRPEGVGHTNRSPGCRVDSQSHTYSYFGR